MRIIRNLIAGLLMAGLFTALPADPAGAAELDDYSWLSVDLEITAVAYDSVSGLLFATVSGTDLTHGNDLVAIDPMSGDVEWSVAIGSDPTTVEVSDDGSTVYVGLDGARSIARVATATRSVVTTFPLPTDPRYGALGAEDIAVAPGQADVIAVALRRFGGTPIHRGVAIFENGVQRPNVTAGHTGSNSIAFGDNATALYGQNTSSTEFGFRRMTVDADGVTVDDVTPLDVPFHSTIVYVDGRIYQKSGSVVDPTVPALVGKYQADRFLSALAPLPSLGRVMTISGTSLVGTETVSFFDIDGFNLVDDATVVHDVGFARGDSVAIDGFGMATPYDEGLLIIGDYPVGTITGRVTDETTGAAISEICVYATDETTLIFGETETAVDGSFSMAVPPGSWYVLFADCYYTDYFWEWHNNQPYYRLPSATQVALGDGQTLNINAALEPSYADALDSAFLEDIWWMHDTGITSGCGPQAYCPDQTVTRGQMAAFLVRALELTAVGGTDFVDDDGHLFETDIEKLATAGITKGCNPPANTNFCPDALVTRGQMAAFLVRALNLSTTSGIEFLDDNGHLFETDIEKLATAGITKGCNPPANTNFCPEALVTRGQMAAFLHRALADAYVLRNPSVDAPERAPSPLGLGDHR